ncbi:MAG: DUF4157 domain-containing protein, partial [Anaerolineae bacterium]|nr:DUF4157 domain-containing protein [Anaerolineae bacterium]
ITQSKSAHKQDAQPEIEPQHKPFRLEDADVMDLQRHLGNQATQSVLGIQRKATSALPSLPGVVQTKMTVNEPGDQYEQEADQVAHEVMTMPDSLQREGMPEEEELQAKRLQRQEMPEEEELAMKSIQRQDMPEEEEELQAKHLQRAGEEEELAMKPIQREGMEEEELAMKPVQREGMEEEELAMKPIQRQEGLEEEELAQAKHISSIQRDSGAAVPPVTEDMESQIASSKGSGQPIPDDTRSFLEPRFGQDFDDVRIHTGAESNDLNNSLQARAFTTGSDIFFRDGDYNPNSDGGRELLAHELTHVVQQGGSSELKTKKDED